MNDLTFLARENKFYPYAKLMNTPAYQCNVFYDDEQDWKVARKTSEPVDASSGEKSGLDSWRQTLGQSPVTIHRRTGFNKYNKDSNNKTANGSESVSIPEQLVDETNQIQQETLSIEEDLLDSISMSDISMSEHIIPDCVSVGSDQRADDSDTWDGDEDAESLFAWQPCFVLGSMNNLQRAEQALDCGFLEGKPDFQIIQDIFRNNKSSAKLKRQHSGLVLSRSLEAVASAPSRTRAAQSMPDLDLVEQDSQMIIHTDGRVTEPWASLNKLKVRKPTPEATPKVAKAAGPYKLVNLKKIYLPNGQTSVRSSELELVDCY